MADPVEFIRCLPSIENKSPHDLSQAQASPTGNICIASRESKRSNLSSFRKRLSLQSEADANSSPLYRRRLQSRRPRRPTSSGPISGSWWHC